MKFMEKVWDNLGLSEASEQNNEQKTNDSERKFKRNRNLSAKNNTYSDVNNVVSLPTSVSSSANPGFSGGLGLASKQLKVMVVEPVSFDDVQHVADYLKSKKPVVVNLENADSEISRRMIDFISGTTYALDGSMQKISNQIFLCAPQNVDVAYSHRDEQQERSMFPWSGS
jgi:cell division inhibitor SepF